MRTTSMTERAVELEAGGRRDVAGSRMVFLGSRGIALDARLGGAILCALGLALLVPDSLASSALAIELLAAAFWLWARAAEDSREQVVRWAWLRRPAMALWLAAAIHAAFPELHAAVAIRRNVAMLAPWEAAAVTWAGLELLAALPLTRPFSDLPGPLLSIRPWLPVILPAAGFVVLWKHASHAFGVPGVQRLAILLLLITATLAALRALARQKWTASLRWLVVTDSALAALAVATRTIPAETTFLLWLAACGGHAFLLAGELRGSFPRRGPAITRLWRAASWTALAGLSWTVLIAVASVKGSRLLYYAVTAIPVTLISWISVGRMLVAPERRMLPRWNPPLLIARAVALLVLTLTPAVLVRAWRAGFEPPLHASVLALAPAVLGGLLALAAQQGQARPFWSTLGRLGAGAPTMAGALFRLVVGIERRLIAILVALVRALSVPLHDLHTGDAQEYLLFLVGLAVLALTAPLLQ